MTKENLFDLKPGENLYKFTDLEIQMICNALAVFSIDTEETGQRLIHLGSTDTGKELISQSGEISYLQQQIENQEHSL